MCVVVMTPSRLHLGILDISGDLGRKYGAIGLAIERPNVKLSVAPLTGKQGDGLQVDGLETERVEGYARRFLNAYPLPHGVRLSLEAHIPAHVGLGSGTQLALAVGTGLAHLGGLELEVDQIAAVMGRGAYSSIGTAAFRSGGFILDGGHRLDGRSTPSDEVDRNAPRMPPVLFQHPLPEDWYFVIAIPHVEPGLSGERERQAFSALPSTLTTLAEKISRLVLMKMLPSLIEADITSFGGAVTETQRLVGDSFASVQGGRYANPLCGEMIAHMLEIGAAGAGQSSWGPTVYGLVDGQEAALRLEAELRVFLDKNGGGQTFWVRADNHGARIEVQ
jgi:beta-ribofuranosylaminobenzene 5'-phosphate synthase